MQRLQEYLNKFGYGLQTDGIIGPKTLDAAEAYLKKRHKELGYTWYATNIVAIRMGTTYSNAFTDFAFVVNSGRVIAALPWTTVPGRYYVYNPLTVGGFTGAAVLVPGQYFNSHAFRKNWNNKWKSPYFEHCGIFKIYRDGNRNDIIDTGMIYDSPPSHGIFLHQMGMVFGNIWNWSAGCQGTLKSEWETKVISRFRNGEYIHYTLLQAE